MRTSGRAFQVARGSWGFTTEESAKARRVRPRPRRACSPNKEVIRAIHGWIFSLLAPVRFAGNSTVPRSDPPTGIRRCPHLGAFRFAGRPLYIEEHRLVFPRAISADLSAVALAYADPQFSSRFFEKNARFSVAQCGTRYMLIVRS
jgi:hypothetical protein